MYISTMSHSSNRNNCLHLARKIRIGCCFTIEVENIMKSISGYPCSSISIQRSKFYYRYYLGLLLLYMLYTRPYFIFSTSYGGVKGVSGFPILDQITFRFPYFTLFCYRFSGFPFTSGSGKMPFP